MNKIFHKIYTFLKIILGWIVYGISFLFPRDKKLWVFIGWHKGKEREIFADNSKYLYLYSFNNLKDKKIFWLGKDKKITSILNQNGLPALYQNSIMGIFYSLRAGYTFIDGYMYPGNWRFSGGSKIMQLWHGKGMKKAGYGTPYSLPRYNRFLSPQLFVKYFFTIASSKKTAEMMSSAFRVPKDKVLISGLPRNDVLFKKIKGAEIDVNNTLEEKLKKINGKKILYAPTFRPDGSNPLEQIDFDALNKILTDKNFYFFVQLHPKFAAKKYGNKNFGNIIFVDAGYDIYPLLNNFDAMITDYSSLYVDFLLLNRPLIFFIYDLEKYKKEMGLYENFENLTPGPHAKNFSELLNAIDNFEKDSWKQKRQEARKELFTFIDGGASQRIINAIVQEKVL